VFGGYTDIPWNSQARAARRAQGNSFIFFSDAAVADGSDIRFVKKEVQRGSAEAFHSPDCGPHFMDLIIRSPTDPKPSEACAGQKYHLSKNDIADSTPDKSGRQEFRYLMFEVFALPAPDAH